MYGDDGPATYDGFISYSHAADDLLAPRLQAGLQRFAKPWWKRRAVRIFRDETSLAANPHLWSSITDALDDSGWFVLLLSEDAAQSEWVNKEIEHWVEHKPSDRILPVVTDGEFGWVDGDVAGSSVPPALAGVFSEEPRWVDLRFARGEENLDLKNPDFSSAVADIASAVRGIPKDELASEEVRQHRRTVRTAWAAGIALTVLAIAAVVAGVFAIGQRNDARDNAIAERLARSEADINADRAEQNAALAEQNAAEAQANAEEATRNAALAEARELAASAINVLDEDPELSILLTLEAIDQTPTGEDQPAEVIDALWQAARQHRLAGVIDTGRDWITTVAVSADGSMFAVSEASGAVLQLYEVPNGPLLWEYRGGQTDEFVEVSFSPNGRYVSVGALDTAGPGARIVILNVADGSEAHTIPYSECQGWIVPWDWSADGELLVVTNGNEPCRRQGIDGGAWADIFDTDRFERVGQVDALSEGQTSARFDDANRLYLFSTDGTEVTVHDPPNYNSTRLLEEVAGVGDVSHDGSTIVTFNQGVDVDVKAYDAVTGGQTDILPVSAQPFWAGMGFGPGDMFAAPTAGTPTLVWDTKTGKQLFSLPSGPGVSAAITPDGQWLYTGHWDGLVKVWNLGSSVGLQPAGDLGTYEWVNADSFILGPNLGAFVAFDVAAISDSEISPSDDVQIFFFDQATGDLVGDPVFGEGPVWPLSDGRFLFGERWGRSEPFAYSVYNPLTGEGARIDGCDGNFETNECVDPEQQPAQWGWIVSLDGSEIIRATDEGFTLLDAGDFSVIGPFTSEHQFDHIDHVLAFTDDWILGWPNSLTDLVAEDRATGEEVARFTGPSRDDESFNISPDGKAIAFIDQNARTAQIIDTVTWETWEFSFEAAQHRGKSIDAEVRRLALGSENALNVFDLDTGELLQSIPLPFVSDIHWLSEDRVLIGTNNGVWATTSLRTEDLVETARTSLARGFTLTECQTYRIEPCPTLEELGDR